VRPFKGIFCDDISEFESSHPSHAVGLRAGRNTPSRSHRSSAADVIIRRVLDAIRQAEREKNDHCWKEATARIPSRYLRCTTISLASIRRCGYAGHAANVTKRLWEIGDIVDVLEAWEQSGSARG
jgi:hypothetical protein